MAAIYKVRLMFEWGGGCIWCGNEQATEKFNVGPIESVLPLSESMRIELSDLSAWHDKALNWAYPPDPSPWSKKEFQQFDLAALKAKVKLEKELGTEFEVVYEPLGDERT